MSDNERRIPSGKVKRASKMFGTSVRLGGNYIKHYSKKAFNKDLSRSDLDKKNADDIFNTLSQLKGSALKIAQMLSMDQGILPKEYAERFKEAQFNSMALSGPLVVSTFKKYTGKMPTDLFDDFNPKSVHAASIGQVHEAHLNGKKLAVKVQYPGVADSIRSDINMVTPLIIRVMNLPEKALKEYVEEIEDRLVEETDYDKEIENGITIGNACHDIENLIIPKYYKELSGKRILTMEWVEGIPLGKFLTEEKDQEKKNQIGQALLDFFHHQLHELKYFHADFHPGNFLVSEDNKLVALDFGCTKTLPESFYLHYFGMVNAGIKNDKQKFESYLYDLDFLRRSDDKEWHDLFFKTTFDSLSVIAEPLKSESFYFGDKKYFQRLKDHGDVLMGNKKFRKKEAIRGPKDAIYLHRTFYGLYSILHELNATVKMDNDFLKQFEN